MPGPGTALGERIGPGVRLAVSLVALGILAPACGPSYPDPPPTRVEEVTYSLHGEELVDPYRWLEDRDSPETRAWVDAQNEYAERIVGDTPLRARLQERLRELMDRPDIGRPRQAGDFEYFTLRRSGEELAAIYRRPVAGDDDGTEGEEGEQAQEEPEEPEETPFPDVDPGAEYEVVVDPIPMSPGNTTRVDIVDLSPEGRYLLYSVRDGGQDEIEVRVRDLEEGVDLPDRLPEALYSGIFFAPGGEGFYYSRRSRETGARVRFHRLGTDVADDPVLFGEGYGPRSFVSARLVGDARWMVYTVQHGWARTEVWVQELDGEDSAEGPPHEDAGPVRPVVEDAPARFYVEFVDGELWMRTDLGASNNRVLAVDLEEFESLGGSADLASGWREVIPEDDDVMEDFTLIDGRVHVTYLRDVSNVIRVYERDGTPAGEIEVPEHHSAGIREAGEGEAFLEVESFLVPETTYRIDLETGERTLEERPEHQRIDWDASPYEVEQAWYESADGTRVPMYVVRARGLDLDGSHPALLTGYGGFYAARKPGFSVTAAVWLESGGVYAVPNIRGGSEFGEAWHRDGMLENKQNVFDDFIAAAEWLVDSGHTAPERLAISGTSNGGLLVGAALTQRPELFRAVLCGFPDVDILRFFEFTENNNMPALLEYGDASIEEQFRAIREYSPYQNVEPGTPYPAVMISSGDLDTRVPPLAARKFTARLQAATSSGLPVILRYHPKAGHAAGRGLPFSRQVEDDAMELAFVMSELGMETGRQP